MPEPLDLSRLPGLHGGGGGLSGPLHALAERLDAAFVRIAGAFSAEPRHHAPLVPVEVMRRLDYFSGFPHLVMWPSAAERSDQNLRAFRDANAADAGGPLALPAATAPVDAVLAPAACYAVYPTLEGDLSAARAVTLCGTCFRAEDRYEPLRRQRAFRMREIVLAGTLAEVKSFLDRGREAVLALAARLELEVQVAAATDPFFDPARSSRFLHQKLFPTKHELLFEGELAIGSFNHHRAFFGEVFGIRTPEGPAQTACIAFGLERWVYAVVKRHGPDPASWSRLPAEG